QFGHAREVVPVGFGEEHLANDSVDERMTSILERAARKGRSQMLVSAFASSRPDRIAWPALVSDNPDWKTASGTDMEARDRWFAPAKATLPARSGREPGAGSLLAGRARQQGRVPRRRKDLHPQDPAASPRQAVLVGHRLRRRQPQPFQTDQDKSALRSAFELT